MFALFLVGAVLLSSVLDQFLRGVSLPLVQMAIGVAMYFLIDLPIDGAINNEIFLVMFIAPLLFDESRNVNNRMLWENRSTILSLAVGLVIASVLIVGFALHIIVPSVSLAAAFALGAALGPTDAVAVTSLSKTVRLSSRQKASLLGEALLNDASGIVSFQFAIAATVTGAFSLADASRVFFIEFIGGIVFGLIIAVLAFIVMRNVRRAGVESATFHVCFELFLPFFIYLMATQIHVSGILAVVAAGLLLAYIPQRVNPNTHNYLKFSSRLSIASESVWKLFSFVLNGVIFTDLGIVLCQTIVPAMQENSADIIWLIGMVLFVTFVATAVRFVWVLVCDLLSNNPDTGKRMKMSAELARNALVTTLCGPKGAVSLSITSTIPVTLSNGALFPQRDLLLFLVCGVVIATLLMANFLVPVIAPKLEDDDSDELDPEVEIEILENVITGLRRRMTPENKRAIGSVMRIYFARLSSSRKKVVSTKQLRYLRQEVLLHQRDYIRNAIQRDQVDRRLGERYLKQVDHILKVLSRKRRAQYVYRDGKQISFGSNTMQEFQIQVESRNKQRESIIFKIGVESVAVNYLEEVSKNNDNERGQAALALLGEHKSVVSVLKSQLRNLDLAQGIIVSDTESTLDSQILRTDTGKLYVDYNDAEHDDPPFYADVQAEALRLELDQIQEMYEAGRISQSMAREMREEIYLLQMGLSD